MKKSLLAVAVAAALPVVAHAQVTLSGRIDTAVVNSKSSSTGKTATGLSSSTLTTNQLVLQGSEDVVGGMKANFIINSQFASDEKAALDWVIAGSPSACPAVSVLSTLAAPPARRCAASPPRA